MNNSLFSGMAKNSKKIAICLGIIIVAAFIVRSYNFEDWLFFKMDQARDAILISKAFENGPSELPLLGPKAGGTFLRVGPAFYYFQYLSTKISNSTNPTVFAYPDLFFSILTIPLLFFFLRKFFSINWSLALTFIFSFSFLATEYSRFAWNPNSVPFFNLLFFYSLLEIFDKNKERRNFLWTVVAGLSFAVSTQLHFVSFISLPLITLCFILIRFKHIKKSINWKVVLLFFGAVIFLYIPMILSELITKWDSVHQFLASIENKSSDHPIGKKILRDVYYFGYYYFMIWTGGVGKRMILIWASEFAILFSLVVNFFLLKKEKDGNKRNFLWLSILCFSVYFLVYIPLAYDIRPRFFLPMLHLPFIFLGYFGYLLTSGKITDKYLLLRKIIVAFVLIAAFLGNIYGIFVWYGEMRNSERGVTLKPRRTIILKGIDGITWWHTQKVAEYIHTDCQEKNIGILISGKELKSPINYALKQLGNTKRTFFDDALLSDSCYYIVKKTRGSIPEKTEKDFVPGKPNEFGDITVMRAEIKYPEKINSESSTIENQNLLQDEEGIDENAEDLDDSKSKKTKNKNSSEGEGLPKQPRYYWKDVFSRLF